MAYLVLGNALKFGLREEIELVFVFMSSEQRRKRKFNFVFVQVLKNRAARAKFVVFHLLIGLVSFDVLIAFTFVVAPRIYRHAYAVRNPNTFLVKPPSIFSVDRYVIQDKVH